MDFNLTDDQRMIREMARDFSQAEIAPKAAEIDKTGAFPADILKQMGDLGLMGLPIAEEYGGAGADYTSYCLALEEITRACGSTGLTYEAHISLGCMPIYYYGTEEQKQKYLPLLCSGESLGSFGLTEPNAGSDAGGTQTTAILVLKTENGSSTAPRSSSPTPATPSSSPSPRSPTRARAPEASATSSCPPMPPVSR